LRLTSVAQMDRPVIALVLITLVAPLMSFAGICLPRKSQQTFSVLMMSIATLAALGLFINQWHISNVPVRIAWFAVGTLSFEADLIEIGRASCRERVEVWVASVACKTK